MYIYIHIHTCDTSCIHSIYTNARHSWLERQRGLSSSTETEEDGHVAGPQGATAKGHGFMATAIASPISISWDMIPWMQHPKLPLTTGDIRPETLVSNGANETKQQPWLVVCRSILAC